MGWKEMVHFVLRMMNPYPYPLQNSSRKTSRGLQHWHCVVSVKIVPHSPAVTLPAPAPGHQCLQSLEMMTRQSTTQQSLHQDM